MKAAGLFLVIVGTLADKAPYPPSGWKPKGTPFLLPQEQYGPPQPSPPQGYGPPQSSPPQEYGPPQSSPPQGYGPPQSSPPQGYGPPQPSPPQEYGPAQPSPPQEYGPATPPQEYGPPQNDTTPQPEEDIEKANERLMERLRNEEGADTGVYYVYLPDGRLQRVQYTTAPLKAASSQQNQQTSFSNFQQTNQQAIFGNQQVGRQANSQSFGGFGSFGRQQTSYDVPAYPPAPAPSSRFSQAAAFQSQGSTRYDGTSKVTKNNKAVEVAGSPNQLLAKYTSPAGAEASPSEHNEEQPSKYVASVSFTDVAPISGPIYSFNNQPLVRVLRYAPGYQ